MIKTFIIIFTQMLPNVDGMLQEIPVFSTETCQKVVDKIDIDSQTIVGYTAHARCETRQLPEKEEQ